MFREVVLGFTLNTVTLAHLWNSIRRSCHWLYESLGYCSQFSFKLMQCGAPPVQYTSVGCILQVPGRPRDKKLAAISEQIMSAPGCCLHTWWLGWGTWPLLSKWSRRIPKWLGGSLKRSVPKCLYVRSQNYSKNQTKINLLFILFNHLPLWKMLGEPRVCKRMVGCAANATISYS